MTLWAPLFPNRAANFLINALQGGWRTPAAS